jgi:hypothetical protein
LLHHPVGLQQMPLIMRYDEPEVIPQSQSDQLRKCQWDPDTLQVLRRDMPENIIQRITLLQETLQLIISVQALFAGMKAPGRR